MTSPDHDADGALRAKLLGAPLAALTAEARALRDAGRGPIQTYSRKVFIPLTRLCRDYCHYCTFSRPHERGQRAYLSADEVVEIARRGAAAGCSEALFTLGDKPELRHPIAREELDRMGYASTVAYLAAMCALVLRETGLLPHANAGVMTRAELAALREVTASQGLMLESAAARLGERGGPHYRSPDKAPQARLATIELAGELAIPFTSGILIGIGETRAERLDALVALRAAHRRHGHIQEIIVQNFRAKPGTPMAASAEPSLAELMWSIAAARLLFGPEMNIQAPPNLSDAAFPQLLDAGINDWGGVSPVTPDHVNPEAPWPQIEALRAATAARGRTLAARLPLYPSYTRAPERWLAPALRAPVLRASDAEGYAREDQWCAGAPAPAPSARCIGGAAPGVRAALARIVAGEPREADVTALFGAHGEDCEEVCAAADELRQRVCGDAVSYVVNRNINYTNICLYSCGFCAFSKGSTHEALRGAPYDLDHAEIARRVREAAARGATEVCLQGGIHPRFTGETYLDICRTVREAAPELHIHAFSPLEVAHGAATLGISPAAFLTQLKAAGLGTLPGTAAEILDDEVRALICPDKLDTEAWLAVIAAAHESGLRTTATIMFGHVDTPTHWARHLLRLRALAARTGGFTEFVPLPFVHMEAPMSLRGRTRKGPTWREARLMHAAARLVLNPYIVNIQASWTKLGPEGARLCLEAGANDLGGTLMNESISRAAGAAHGQEMAPAAMQALIRSAGRTPVQRTTLYARADAAAQARAMNAAPLLPIVQTPPHSARNRRIEREPA